MSMYKPPSMTSSANVSPALRGASNVASNVASPSLGSAASRETVQESTLLGASKGWEAVQKKTFTNWTNTRLEEGGKSPVADVYTDFASGEKLIELLEVLTKESLGRYNKQPKMRIQKVENVAKALQVLKLQNVNLVNIGAEDISDGNEKLILGLLWSLILKYSLAEISEEGKTAKEGLLIWCQRKTAPYKPTVDIKDFTRSWQDGLGLCALIHRYRPDLLDFHKLSKSDRLGNATLAMDVAEKHLGIRKLLSPEDLINTPDEKSNMTYIAQYHKALAAMDKVDIAGRRAAKFVDVLATSWSLQNDYEARTTQLLHAINDQLQAWKNLKLAGGYRDAKKHLQAFDQHKSTTKRQWVTEKRELESLLGNIQTKLKTYGLAAYQVPEGLAPQDVEDFWTAMVCLFSKANFCRLKEKARPRNKSQRTFQSKSKNSR
jgi:hypothetical protein